MTGWEFFILNDFSSFKVEEKIDENKEKEVAAQ